jgi:predicted unusual protein kinase regulating ubiquinone biosynthesis (AarF/ABC1/UbiB family)
MFIKDLGSPPGELFSSFDPNSIAAASLAEVFKATTHDGQGIISHIVVIHLLKETLFNNIPRSKY